MSIHTARACTVIVNNVDLSAHVRNISMHREMIDVTSFDDPTERYAPGRTEIELEMVSDGTHWHECGAPVSLRISQGGPSHATININGRIVSTHFQSRVGNMLTECLTIRSDADVSRRFGVAPAVTVPEPQGASFSTGRQIRLRD